MSKAKGKTRDYWKKKLTAEQYKILREKGTEPAFSGELNKHYENGMYVCAGCGQELFSSKAKYDSKSGWPSFYEAVDNNKVKLEDDSSLGMRRVEVVCSKCDSHLGHIFDDGPKTLPDGRQATGKRYCINSAALNFQSIKNNES